MLLLPISRTHLSIFDSFPQTEGAGNQRYPDTMLYPNVYFCYQFFDY